VNFWIDPELCVDVPNVKVTPVVEYAVIAGDETFEPVQLTVSPLNPLDHEALINEIGQENNAVDVEVSHALSFNVLPSQFARPVDEEDVAVS
jgi:hypothetical protein